MTAAEVGGRVCALPMDGGFYMVTVRQVIGKGVIPGAMAMGDASAVMVIAASFVGWLPPFAGALAIVWYTIQILESHTVQNLMRTRRLRRLVKLRAEAAALELMIREKNTDLKGLDRANELHTASLVKADELTHQQRLKDDAEEEADIKSMLEK